jgi:hypothetical protein
MIIMKTNLLVMTKAWRRPQGLWKFALLLSLCFYWRFRQTDKALADDVIR